MSKKKYDYFLKPINILQYEQKNQKNIKGKIHVYNNKDNDGISLVPSHPFFPLLIF